MAGLIVLVASSRQGRREHFGSRSSFDGIGIEPERYASSMYHSLVTLFPVAETITFSSAAEPYELLVLGTKSVQAL